MFKAPKVIKFIRQSADYVGTFSFLAIVFVFGMMFVESRTRAKGKGSSPISLASIIRFSSHPYRLDQVIDTLKSLGAIYVDDLDRSKLSRHKNIFFNQDFYSPREALDLAFDRTKLDYELNFSDLIIYDLTKYKRIVGRIVDNRCQPLPFVMLTTNPDGDWNTRSDRNGIFIKLIDPEWDHNLFFRSGDAESDSVHITGDKRVAVMIQQPTVDKLTVNFSPSFLGECK